MQDLKRRNQTISIDRIAVVIFSLLLVLLVGYGVVQVGHFFSDLAATFGAATGQRL